MSPCRLVVLPPCPLASSPPRPALLTALAQLAGEFGKQPLPKEPQPTLRRDDLRLICFEHVSG
ncbi:MAG: hypothetical protein WD229_09230 [Pirellulales bacterium]